MPGLIISVIQTVSYREPRSVFRPGIRKRVPLLVSLFVFIVNLGACRAISVLDLPLEEAAERLRQGDIAFILNADPRRIEELRRIHPSAVFYAGLLAQSPEAGTADNPGLPRLPALLFGAALESPSRKIQEEAAVKLLPLVLEGEDTGLAERFLPGLQKRRASLAGTPGVEELYGGVLYTLGRFDELSEQYRDRNDPSPWGRALFLLGSIRAGENRSPELLDFFLSGPLEGPHHWAFREIRKLPSPFSSSEAAAIAGRFSVARFAYDEGLKHFRIPLEGQSLFFAYPELLADLGKAFQYTAAGEEGIKLFSEWDERIRSGGEGLTTAEAGNIRFRLWYYGGRILRQREQYGEAVRFFTRALSFAPDPLQRDACIWYILEITLEDDPGAVIPLLKTYITLWHEDEYFTDLLDQLARELILSGQWDSFLAVFPLIRPGTDGISRAKYAYIIGRAVLEGYIPAAKAGNLPDFSGAPLGSDYKTAAARPYFRIVLEEKKAPFYYRALAAVYLGEEIPPIPEEISGGTRTPSGEGMDFFLGFFTYGAASYAFSYLAPVMGDLPIGELRFLAETFAKAGRWGDSIRISAHYMAREDYRLSRRDLELAYPRPFIGLIEGSARKERLPPEILYGLIRTESAFIPDIGSRAGAIGLTQLMAATAEEMAGRIRREGGPDYRDQGEIDLRNPEINIPLGTRYLRYLMDRMESPMLALLAYNGGMGRLSRWRTALPELPGDLFPETIEVSETRDYGRKVLSSAAVYGYLYYGMTMEAVVADIFIKEVPVP
ncbi:lytic transglycosylase domain-containing protein [Treponema sp. TIM-1]|uniref:flagellar assembly lytic transglycosylase n=1 Tax=Treponema sp. TIM-1 TaxID=2898417 RepID=UPI00397F9177